jgi:hypothetical protein
MKLYNLIGLILILPLVAFAKPISTEDLKISDLTPQEQVIYYANQYGADADLVSKVIENESGWKHNVCGDGGRSCGIGQFQKSSFERMSKAMGQELDYNSVHDQLKLISWAFANGYEKEWTAFRCIKNGGTYSFYSRQLQKHFTISCKI